MCSNIPSEPQSHEPNPASNHANLQLVLEAAGLNGVVTADMAVLRAHAQDYTGGFRSLPELVALPHSTDEVCAVVSFAHDIDAVLIPWGGNTGLTGATICDQFDAQARPRIVVDCSRLNSVGPLTQRGTVTGQPTVTVGAGVTLAELEEYAAEHGLTCGVHLASGGQAQVGGVVATNAGGARVMRYGTTADHVVGLEAVLADGKVFSELHPLPKDNTGLRLRDLFIGSEGTLGIITAVQWALHPAPQETISLGIRLPDMSAAVRTVEKLASLPQPAHLGFSSLDWIDGRAPAALGLASPLPHGGVWLMGDFISDAPVSSPDELVDHLTDALMEIAEEYGGENIVVATSRVEREELWSVRESMTDSIGKRARAVKLDVAVPRERCMEFYESLVGSGRAWSSMRETPETPWVVLPFGHLAEANFHVNIVPAYAGADAGYGVHVWGTADGGAGAENSDSSNCAESADEFSETERAALTEAVLNEVMRCSGTISAEHGVGRLKRDWLPKYLDPAAQLLNKGVKSAMDPANCLNPGLGMA